MVDARRYRDKEWLEGEVRAGKSPEQIAIRCGVTTQTIERWIKKHSITPYTDEEWLAEQLSNYIPVSVIAEWCCVTEQTITNWIRRYDLEHPGVAPPEVLRSYLEQRLAVFDEEYKIPKSWQIEELRRRYHAPVSHIVEAVDANRRYVYQVLTGHTEWGRSEPVSAAIREQILSRDNYRCVRCSSFENVDLQVHHIIPGESTETNLATLCFDCHLEAHGGNYAGSTIYDPHEEFWGEWIETK